jgi:hypothetical protein
VVFVVHVHGGMSDVEPGEVKEALHGITKAMQSLAVDHATLRGTIDSVQQNINHLKETLVDARRETTASILVLTGKVDGVMGAVPELQRRVSLLEKVVLGACGIILIAVITAWVKGAVIIPGITTGGAQVTVDHAKP